MMCRVCKREDVTVVRDRLAEHYPDGTRCEDSGKLPSATEVEKAQYTPVPEIGL